MVNFGDVGIICVNRDLKGLCQNCLWWEWDSGKQHCCNGESPICAIYRQQLLIAGPKAPIRPATPPKNGLLAANGGLGGLPVVKAKEAGNG